MVYKHSLIRFFFALSERVRTLYLGFTKEKQDETTDSKNVFFTVLP